MHHSQSGIWRVCAAAAAAGLLLTHPCLAAEYGTRFQVNTSVTAGDQTDPDVAVNKYGTALVVWENPTNDGDIFFRMLFSDGTSLGDTRLNTFTTGDQHDPQVAALAAGSFAVVWSSDTCILGPTCDPDYDSIVAQVVTPLGMTLAEDAFVGQYTNDLMEFPDVAPLAGGFVVVWSSASGPPSGGDTDVRIEASKHAIDGQRIGSEFQVNLVGDGWQLTPAVAERPLFGGFHVLFSSDPTVFGAPNDDRAIKRRTVNADGSFYPAEVWIDSAAQVSRPDIATNAADNYIMAWESGNGLEAATVSRCVAGETFVDSSGSGGAHPRVASFAWEGWVMTHSNNNVLQWNLIDGMSFEADGGVLTGVGTDLGEHGVATFPSGEVIAVWDEGNMASIPGSTDVNRGIAAIVVVPNVLFKNGFECGGDAFWTETVQ